MAESVGPPSTGGTSRITNNSNSSIAASPPAAAQQQSPRASQSPPKAIVDTSPISNAMEQNKQSLKVKLMLRRPINQLVAQGIMPPLKTPPAFHEQRRQLERAKTGDMLKAKIQQRPARVELERRHILEAEPCIDPSLVEKQRMLKKARLADQLNDSLSHRPGVLELIQKNILHTEEPIEEAVKAGKIPFRATCEGQINKPQHPNSYLSFEEDSQSSEGDSISQGEIQTQQANILESAAKNAGIVVSLKIPQEANNQIVVTSSGANLGENTLIFGAPMVNLSQVPSPASLITSTSTLSPISPICSPIPQGLGRAAPGKDKKKKSKNKAAPKARTIKFHEYKGPPNAQKNPIQSGSSETSYELLLKQQQLFLQWQLQLQHKYPQIILPATQKDPPQGVNNQNNTISSTTDPPRILSKLDDLKVSDLKQELKKRNLPVSGSKPQLIERLKPFLHSSNEIVTHSGHIIMDTPTPLSCTSEESSTFTPESTPRTFDSYEENNNNSPISQEDEQEMMEVSDPKTPLTGEVLSSNIVMEQQRQIEELQRKLTLSQLQLQQVREDLSKKNLNGNGSSGQNGVGGAGGGDAAKANKLLQQHLQARQQQHQIAMQVQQIQALQQATQNTENRPEIKTEITENIQNVAFQNSKNLTTNGLILNNGTTLLLNNLPKIKLNGQRTYSLPNFLNSLPVVPLISTDILHAAQIQNDINISEKVSPQTQTQPQPPPMYEEATKNVTIKKEKNIKSEIVDDVLEILIKNGELPPSAAQDPTTPNDNNIKTNQNQPIFPLDSSPSQNNQLENNDNYLNLDTNDLENLGLNLETLDAIDFSQLEMDINLPHPTNNQCDYSSIPMDTDDSDWLESLLPTEHCGSNVSNVSIQPIASFDHDMTSYDPLLSNQDPFDLFNLEEFKGPSEIGGLQWDKVDFAA